MQNIMVSKLKEQVSNSRIIASQITPELVRAYMGLYNVYLKRIGDFFLAAFFSVLLLPLFIFVSIAIAIESGTPIFYCAERGGYKGKTFSIYKFRSMVKGADKIGSGTTAMNDIRITKIGNILRKTKVDEFPNLINILLGDMSFIGPRPELLKYTKKYAGTEKLIFNVRPGITDYSSIEFINLDEIVGDKDVDVRYENLVLPQKNKLRILYAGTVSFETDCSLFFKTIGKVLVKIMHVFKVRIKNI